MASNDRPAIQVAGDVCLDVLGIPVPPPAANARVQNNWQLTGETRTHFLLGGSAAAGGLGSGCAAGGGCASDPTLSAGALAWCFGLLPQSL